MKIHSEFAPFAATDHGGPLAGSSRGRAFGLLGAVAFALTVGLAGCSADDPVVGPDVCVGDACLSVDAGPDGGDLDDAKPARAVDFYLETDSGDWLKGVGGDPPLTPAADKYKDVAGTQIDVVIATTNVPDGTEAEVFLNGTGAGKAAIVGGQARINQVTLPCSQVPVGIAVRVQVAPGDAAEQTKNVQLDCGANACQAAIVPVTGCILNDHDPQTPGFQYTFTVTTETPDCTHAYLTVTGTDGKSVQTAPVALQVGSSVAIQATLSPDDKGLFNAQASVTATLVDQTHPERQSVPSAPVQVVVTTEKPVVTVTQPPPLPGDPISKKNDLDPAADGIQVVVTGTVQNAAPGDAVELLIDGVSIAKTTVKVNSTFEIPVTFTQSKAHSMNVVVTTSCGVVNNHQFSYSVFTSEAEIIIQTPAPGVALLAKDDGNQATTTIYETSVVVGLIKPAAKDTVLELFCKKATPGSVYPPALAKATVLDSTATSVPIPVDLDVDTLGNEVTCYVHHDAPNPVDSQPVTFKIGLPPPCLVDQGGDVTVTTASLDVLLTATSLDGVDVTAKITSAGGLALDPIVLGKVNKGALSAKIALVAGTPPKQLDDGEYTLTFEAQDAYGNLASASKCSKVQRKVTIDTTGPTLAVTLPSKATLTTLDDPDSNKTLQGYQIVVEANVTDAKSACLAIGSAKPVCQVLADGATKVTFADVSLQPGANTLQLTATDVNGNKTTAAPLVVTLVSDVPVVQFLEPAGSVSTAKDTLTFKVQVSNPSTGGPVAGAETEIYIDNAKVSNVTVTEQAPGVYVFDVTGLSKGVTTVQFGAAAVGASDKKGYSSILVITFKNKKPGATITAPANGAIFKLSSPECVTGVAACLTKVTVATPDAEDGSAVELAIDCGPGKGSVVSGIVAGGNVTFPQVTLADQSTCKLTATVTDLAEQTVKSEVVEVTIDRTPPTFGVITSPIGKTEAQITLIAVDDSNSDPSDGMQVLLQVQATGLQKGASVQLDVFDDNGAKVTTYQAKDVPEIPDATKGSVSFGVITLPDGFKIKLQFTAADKAGNQATKTVVAQVLSAQPDVKLGAPLNNFEGKTCTANADCGSAICFGGKCVVPWNKAASKTITVQTSGVPQGTNMRLCSNAPGLTGTDCVTAGYKVVATGVLGQGKIDFTIATLADALHTFTAEAENTAGDSWSSSTTSSEEFTRKRTILLDTIAPVVQSVTAPTAADVPAGCLSDKLQTAADLGQPGGKFTFQVTTDEDATFTVTVGGQVAGSTKAAAKSGSVEVAMAAEGTATVAATAVDRVGNVGEAKSAGNLQVNTVAPTGTFLQPSKAILLVGDSLDVKIQAGATDLEGTTVALKDAGTAKASVSFASGVALWPDAQHKILTQGSHTLTADLKDVCGNSLTIGTQPQTVNVDVQPPLLAFGAPTQGTSFGDAQDADAGQGGYQVSTEFSTTDAVSWTLQLGTDCDGSFANCAGFANISSGKVQNPGGTEPKVLVTIPFGVTPNYSLRLQAVDASGNQTTVERGFAVKLSGCLVQLKGLPDGGLFNTQLCPTKGQACASVTQTLTAEFVGPCGTVTEVQLKKGTTVVAKKAPTGATAAFDLVLTDGESSTLEAVVVAGAQTTSSGAVKILVDLTPPVAKFVAGTVAGKPTYAGGTAATLLGLAADVDTGSAGHQIHALLQVDDAGLAGGKLTKLERTVGATTAALALQSPQLPLTLTGKTQTVEIQLATLAENATNTVAATVTDAAGNTGTAALTVIVDWTAPAAPVLADFQASDLNPRRPLARLTFPAVGDNGTTGQAASYEVRYSRKAITNVAEFEAACDAKDLPNVKLPTPAAAGTAEQVFVEGPDPRPMTDLCKFSPQVDDGITKFYFAVRAVDPAGNKSAMSNVVSTAALRLRYAKINLAGTYDAPEYRGRVWKGGDLNGDGLGDLVLGGGDVQQMCVIYGRQADATGSLAAIDLSTASSANHVCLSYANGFGAPVGAPGDVNGDGVDDLIVGAEKGAGLPRAVRVYLGKKNGVLGANPDVVITNVSAISPVAHGVHAVAAIGNFNGDVTAGGKPIHDIAVTSRPSGAISYDRVFVIPGKSSWTPGQTQVTIDLSNSSQLTSNNVLWARLIDSSGSPAFGHNLFGAGNLLLDNNGTGPQFDDLIIHQAATPQGLVILKGRSWTGQKELLISSNCCSGANDTEMVRIKSDATTGINQMGRFTAVTNLDGDNLPDLVLQHQLSSAIGGIYWLRGKDLAANLGKSVTLNNTLVAGETTLYNVGVGFSTRAWHQGMQALGNFSDQQGQGARIDIVHGRPTFQPQFGANQVVIRIAMLRPASAIKTEIGFQYEDIVIPDPFVPGNQAWGVTSNNPAWASIAHAPVGDFTGDGLPDLAIGSQAGSLVIVY